MIEEKTNKKKQIVMSILVASLVLIITGVTYAVFSYSNSSINNNNTIKSGQVTMTYSEQSNSYIVENALPKKDAEGMNENNYFEFTVTSSAKTNATDTVGIQIPYEINLSSKQVEEGKQQLQEENIKVYLTKVEDGKEVGVTAPTKISELGNSLYRENATKLAYKLNLHKNGNETISTTYRLRAWIDILTDASTWSEDNKYQYKFTVNINSDTKYVGYTTDPACFTFEDDGNGGKKITGFSSTCSATNIIVPNTYTSKTVIPGETKQILNSYTANEEEWIKMWKNNLLEEGQTYEDYLTANNLTDEQVIAEAKEGLKEITDQLDPVIGKIITGTGTAAEEIYSLLQDPTQEAHDIYSKIFTMNVETKTTPEHTEYKDYKVTALNTLDLQNKNIKTVVLPDDISIGYPTTFMNNKVDLITNVDGNLPNRCYTITDNKLTYLKCNDGIINLDLSSLKIEDISTTIADTVESIQFPSTLTTISGNIAPANLKVVDLSNTQLTTIGSSVFYGTHSITTVKFPSTLTSIGDKAFYGNKIESLDLSNTKVTSIGTYAFINNKITSLKLPNTLTTIGMSTFSGNNLTTITLPNTLTTIGANAFYGNKIENLDLSEHTNLTKIGSSAFAGNKITSVKLPSSLTTIGREVFSGNNLTNLDLSNTKIISIADKITDNSLSKIKFPSTLTTIGSRVFINNNLTELDLSNTKVTSIGTSAFNNNKIASIKFPSTLTTIDDYAFENNKLTELNLSNTQVTTIKMFAFRNNNLKTITLPATVTELSASVFSKTESSNPNLTSIIYPGTTALTWDYAIGGANNTTKNLPPYTYKGVSITAN